MGVNSLPKTVTRQHRACDFWTQALLPMSPAWARFLVYNTGLVQYRWTGLDLLTADRVKMQDWKIVNSSKYSLSCCTYVFHRCRFVLAFSVAPMKSSGIWGASLRYWIGRSAITRWYCNVEKRQQGSFLTTTIDILTMTVWTRNHSQRCVSATATGYVETSTYI